MAQINTATWREYFIKDIFPSIIKPDVYHVKHVEEDPNGIPYVVRSKFNNGTKFNVKRPKGNINPAHVISFGAENATFFYQANEWVSGRDIYYIDTRNLNEYTCLFLTACLQPIAKKYSYNFGLFPELLKQEKIKLPSDKNGNPDFTYMENFMRELEVSTHLSLNRLKSAKHFDKAKCINDKWMEFSINSLFAVVKGTRLTKADMKDGSIRFIGASAMNNGITAYISNNEKLHPKNTITISYNGSVGEAFYQDEPFWASDDVNVLYPKFNMNFYIAMFLIPALKAAGRKYAFIDKWKKEDMEKDCIMLPVDDDGNPNWTYMENYIKATERKIEKSLTDLQATL